MASIATLAAAASAWLIAGTISWGLFVILGFRFVTIGNDLRP